jgi:hypothetical protein
MLLTSACSVITFDFLCLNNEGYFARWAALRKLLNQFLDTEVGEKGQLKKQILSLGAGFDTTYFQLQVTVFLCVFVGCVLIYLVLDKHENCIDPL